MTRPRIPYSKVIRSTWGDQKFRRLSPLRPSGQALWLYLLTGPHCTVIPGLFPKMGIGTLADALQWPHGGTLRAWNELHAEGMTESDWAAGVIWLPKAIEHNDPESPNVVTSWRSVPLPQCELVTRALRSIRVYLASKENSTWVEAFDDAFRKAFPEALGESRTGTGTGTGFPPYPPQAGGPVQAVEISDKHGGPLRVIRADRNEARLFRKQTGGCPHDSACESYSICVEHIAVAIAIRRDEIRRHAS